MTRLDKEMVARGLAPSRTRAAQLISDAAVSVDGGRDVKASTTVTSAAQITVAQQTHWVSRAAHKLLGALQTFPSVEPAGARCLDAGASTGGFSHVLLEHGAAHVTAADVGHDQLAAQLREHHRVTNYEGINLRYVQPGDLGEAFELIVADLSFISLRLVLGPLARLAAEDADLLIMVKPQFEVGRARLPRTGVVTDPTQRRDAVEGVIAAAAEAGLRAVGVARSPLAGQDGNAEFFLHLWKKSASASALDDRLSGAGPNSVDLDAVDFSDPQSQKEVR